jgi:hypothetical protein
MSWQNDIINVVRVLINDLDLSNPTYSDDRLVQIITVAARYVQFDINLSKEYVIDSINNTITPDPTVEEDEIFLCLIGLKASCIIDQSTFRTKALLNGIVAGLGPVKLSVGNNLAGFKEILEHGPCKLYSDLTEHWDVQNATAIAAVLSPFIGNKFDPMMLPYEDYRYRNFYT